MAVYPRTDKSGKQRRSPDGRPVWRFQQWVAGRSHETTFTGTKAEAKSADAKWRIELEAAAGAPKRKGEGPTLLAFCAGPYADHARAHLAASTLAVRVFQLENVCRHLGGLKLTAIDTAAVERFKAARTAEGARPGTVNTELAKLQAVLTFARDLGEPVATPKIRQLPVAGKGRVKFWAREQLAALFAAVEAEAPDLLPLVVFLANTGCRKGEALACERSWIDLGAGMIRIEPNEAWQPKDREPREIPISDALRPWLVRAMASGEGKHVFCSRDEARWAYFPRKAFARAVKAAKLDDDGEGPHKLRHSFASLYLAGGGSMFELSRILGHASIRTTERCYAHFTPEHMERSRNVVNLGPGIGAAAHEARKRWGSG